MANRKSERRPSGDKSKGELAFLSEAGMPESGREMDRSPVDLTAASLRQLESEIRQLQEMSKNVENDLSSRDNRIAQLLASLDLRDVKIRSLETNIDEIRTESRRIEVLQSELVVANEELGRLQDEIGSKQGDANKLTECNDELIEHNTELCCKVHDLEMYIDGRQDEWTDLNKRLSDYRNTLAGMEQDIKDREIAASAQEKEKGDLAIHVLELERRCAELDGRRAEREDANTALQDSLDHRTKEVARLNMEESRMESEIKKLNLQADRRGAYEKKSPASNGEWGHSLEEMSTTIADLMEEVRSHEIQLGKSDAHIKSLGEQLVASDAEICLIRNQIDEVSQDRNRFKSEVADARAQSRELAAELEILRTERESIETELCAQRELIDALEGESSGNGDMVDILGLSDDSIIDIGIGTDLVERSYSMRMLENIPQPARHVLVAMNSNIADNKEYLLSKPEMTIGRSRSSDIRIASKYISREHARIIQEDTQTVIEDLGSTNGFLVNSVQKKRHNLQHGDRLKIGIDEFEFQDLSISQ